MLAKATLIQAAKAQKAKSSLAYFVEQTTRDTRGNDLVLHDWQRDHFIPLLTPAPSGKRLRFHAPPQFGKSIIMSKRFPLWLLVNNPLLRVVVVTYNQDFSAGFYDALKSAVYDVQSLVPWFELTGNLTSGLKTPERAALNDGTASIVFATIETGFTGKGCDIVIIDDPYRGLEDAMSTSYRKLVESFFDNKLFPRVNEKTDVYLMYHAWCQGDIGDYAVKKYGFTPVRFAAISDEGEDDPTRRPKGELLSPMRSSEFLAQQELQDPKMFAAMYQGVPIADGERLFTPSMLEGKILPISEFPRLDSQTRGFDTAYTATSSSDHTATVCAAFDERGVLHVRGFKKARVPLGQIPDWVLQIAKSDPPHTWQAVEMHNAGYAAADYLSRQDGLSPWVIKQQVNGTTGKLRVRLAEFHSLMFAGRVRIYMEGDYVKFLDELYTFTGLTDGESDDLLAALAVILLAIKGKQSSNVHKISPLAPARTKPSKLFAKPRRS